MNSVILSRPFLNTVMAVAVALSVVAAADTGLQAEEPTGENGGTNKSDGPAKVETPDKPQIPDKIRLGILVHSYMVALSQANLTGQYNVLHALGAPDFQQRNTPEKLAEIFSTLRTQNIDLTPIIVYSPTLAREPVFDENGLLHLTGYYKTEPQRVNFDLTLQAVAGVWRLYGISVSTSPAPPSEASAVAAPDAKPALEASTPAVPKKKPWTR